MVDRLVPALDREFNLFLTGGVQCRAARTKFVFTDSFNKVFLTDEHIKDFFILKRKYTAKNKILISYSITDLKLKRNSVMPNLTN